MADYVLVRPRPGKGRHGVGRAALGAADPAEGCPSGQCRDVNDECTPASQMWCEPNETFDASACKCRCNAGYRLDTALDKCVPSAAAPSAGSASSGAPTLPGLVGALSQLPLFSTLARATASLPSPLPGMPPAVPAPQPVPSFSPLWALGGLAALGVGVGLVAVLARR